MGGVIECVGGCCVDGDGAGVGLGVWFMAGVVLEMVLLFASVSLSIELNRGLGGPAYPACNWRVSKWRFWGSDMMKCGEGEEENDGEVYDSRREGYFS